MDGKDIWKKILEQKQALELKMPPVPGWSNVVMVRSIFPYRRFYPKRTRLGIDIRPYRAKVYSSDRVSPLDPVFNQGRPPNVPDYFEEKAWTRRIYRILDQIEYEMGQR